MDRLLLAVLLGAVVVAAVLVAQRRRPDPPVRTASFEPPAQLDRRDFDRPDAPWAVVVFTSATCSTCAKVEAAAQVLDSDDVVVQVAEATEQAELHARYGIEAVPMLVVADGDGVVRHSEAGPVSATQLWSALAELRDPDTTDLDGTDPDTTDPDGTDPDETA